MVFFHPLFSLHFSPSPLLPVPGSVLHGRLGGFEVHLEFSAQAPLFLSLFCCNSIGRSHCSACNRISLDEEHHTCLLSPGLENIRLNPTRRGSTRLQGGGKGPLKTRCTRYVIISPQIHTSFEQSRHIYRHHCSLSKVLKPRLACRLTFGTLIGSPLNQVWNFFFW